MGRTSLGLVQFISCWAPVKTPVSGRLQFGPLYVGSQQGISTTWMPEDGGHSRMSRHQVGVCRVGTLNDIDLARAGPVGPVHPDCGSTVSTGLQEQEEGKAQANLCEAGGGREEAICRTYTQAMSHILTQACGQSHQSPALGSRRPCSRDGRWGGLPRCRLGYMCL